MSEEIFDVVDENDECVGQCTRRKVHELGLRHRAVHVLVFNASGDIFLQKRSMTKDCFPGTWDSSASGHLAPGESYEQCAIREAGEELGLELKECPARLFKIGACAETGQEFVWVYRCQAEGPFRLHPEEIETGAWFSPETVTKWVQERPAEFAGGFVLIWRRLNASGPP
jgi:isopentenyl-diphosphate delta-isomerase type 1